MTIIVLIKLLCSPFCLQPWLLSPLKGCFSEQLFLLADFNTKTPVFILINSFLCNHYDEATGLGCLFLFMKYLECCVQGWFIPVGGSGDTQLTRGVRNHWWWSCDYCGRNARSSWSYSSTWSPVSSSFLDGHSRGNTLKELVVEFFYLMNSVTEHI
jgi:hypothetical protein